jgi:hypothetical protein
VPANALRSYRTEKPGKTEKRRCIRHNASFFFVPSAGRKKQKCRKKKAKGARSGQTKNNQQQMTNYPHRLAQKCFVLRLTPSARTAFMYYLCTHPEAKEKEERCSNISDIGNHAEEYFAIELREPEHSDVAQRVASARGIMTKSDVQQWARENFREVYDKKELDCD